MKWEFKASDDDVCRVHEDRYADEIRGPLQGFAWKSDIAYCHASESARIIKIKGSSAQLSSFSERRNGLLFLSEYNDTSDI